MSVDTLPLRLGPDADGMLVGPDEYDTAYFEPGRRLRNYQEQHPEGAALDKTLPEHEIAVGQDRRRADRVIWAGLGRRPQRGEVPTIVVEFVPAGRRSRTRDYDEKRDEYLKIGIQEYWIIDRFQRTMTVNTGLGSGRESKIVEEPSVYATPLLPGFQLALARLFELSDTWDD